MSELLAVFAFFVAGFITGYTFRKAFMPEPDAELLLESMRSSKKYSDQLMAASAALGILSVVHKSKIELVQRLKWELNQQEGGDS